MNKRVTKAQITRAVSIERWFWEEVKRRWRSPPRTQRQGSLMLGSTTIQSAVDARDIVLQASS